jgi:hypothetical protein
MAQENKRIIELFQGATIIKMFSHLVPAPYARTKWCIQKDGVIYYINHTLSNDQYKEITKKDFEDGESETAWTLEEVSSILG